LFQYPVALDLWFFQLLPLLCIYVVLMTILIATLIGIMPGNKTNFDVVKMVSPWISLCFWACRTSHTLSQDGMHALTAFLLFWIVVHTIMQWYLNLWLH
jgi:hypothetical protein